LTQLRDWKSNNARAYFLQHPSASISQASKALGFSTRTCAEARALLASQGLVQPGAERSNKKKRPSILNPPPAPGMIGIPDLPPDKPGTLLDDSTLRALADPSASFDDLNLDDDETRKKLLHEVKRIAFSPETNPDTRLSATQVWLKLKDMAKSRDLGPGKPLTRAAAVARLVSLLRMVGPELALAAMYDAFSVKEPTSEEAKTDQGPPIGGTPEPARTSGHKDPPQAPIDLRPIDLDGRLEQLDLFGSGNRCGVTSGPKEGWPDPTSDPRTITYLDGGTLPTPRPDGL
jgi:hypothetical protein